MFRNKKLKNISTSIFISKLSPFYLLGGFKFTYGSTKRNLCFSNDLFRNI